MVVYLKDSRAPVAYRKLGAFRRHERASSIVHVNVAAGDTIPEVVQQVIDQIRNRRSIWLLGVLCHGNSGRLQLGTGVNWSTAQHFRELAPYMTPGGRGVFLYGCAVASAAPVAAPAIPSGHHLAGARASSTHGGLRMLMGLASAIGTPVYAATDIQLVNNEGHYNGPYVKVFPHGRYQVFDGVTR
jgi:hypothetical protein